MGFDYEAFYKKEGFANGRPNEIVKELASVLPVNARILDLGAGDGRHAKFTSEKGFAVTAVEKSPVALTKLEELVRNGLPVRTIKADLTKPETLPAEDFDGVICTYVTQDMYPKQVRNMMEYIRDCVKPNGYLALSAFMGKFQSHMEVVKETLSSWKQMKEIPGKTMTLVGEYYDKLELLLQKPN